MFTENDMTFNGYNFSSEFYVEEIRRPLMQGLSNNYTSFKTRSIHRNTRREPYQLEVDVRLIENSRQDVTELKRLLASKLYTEKPARLQLRDDSRFDMASLDGQIDFERFMRTGFCTLTFLVYGSSYGLYLASTSQPINYTGTDATYAEIELTALAGSSVSILNVTTGQKVTINRTFTAGEIVKIGEYNSELEFKQTAKINGASIMKYVDVASDFIQLVPGNNQFTITGASAFKISYYERFI